MTPKRPKSLKWIGEQYPDGRPARYLDFVPARDLDEAETDALSQEQLAVIRSSDLYREVHERPATRAPRAPQPTEPEPAADDADTAANPATEGEDK